MTESRNLSARMAHWSAHHRKTAIFGWLAFCLVAFAFGSMVVGVTSLDSSNAGVRESGRMDRLLDKNFKKPAGERVIIQSKTQFQPSALQQASRSARVARGAAANADRVLALWLQIE